MNARAVSAAAGVVHAAELVALRAGAVPLPDDRFAEVRARAAAAEGGWHVVPDLDEPHRFEIHGDGPTVVAVFGGDSYPVRENAEFAAHARQDVPALLAEVDRLAAQVASVRAFATSHEYRWLHELLDGYGTHGGAL